ncbi:MAG: chemotaxis protein CheW [Chitinivibrionales bacterium]|nr:chemotaxis protein CheW [Chitinivibrionales bacterium]
MALNHAHSAQASLLSPLAGKYLTFHLNNWEYAIPVHKVQEVVRIQEITPVPSTPSFIRGLITLREMVLPVIDLRTKFAMPPADDTEQTCIVIVQVVREGRTVTLGVVVDEVREVILLGAGDIRPTPDFGIPLDIQFILGVVKAGARVRLLLDIDYLLTTREIVAVQDVLDGARDALTADDDDDDTDTHEPPAQERLSE